MNSLSSFRRWNSRYIDYEVTNLAHKQVCGNPAWCATVPIRAGINDGECPEASCCFDNSTVIRIAMKLGVVIDNDWLGDEVGTSREVDDGRSGGRRLTHLRATAALIRYSTVDCIRVVSDAVTCIRVSDAIT